MRKAMLSVAVFGLAGLLFVMPLSAEAQTKTSGTLDCSKYNVSHEIKVPEQEGFSYVIGQSKCTWPKSYTVDGLQSTQNVGVEFDEMTGTSGRMTVTGFTQYTNGDRAYHRSIGSFDNKTMLGSGTWIYTRGTGKLSGIKGSGTFTCKMKNDGGSTCEVKGEYTLPAAKK
jgi:hypothetical protein